MNAKRLLLAVSAAKPGHHVTLFLADNGALAVSIVEHGAEPIGIVRLDDGDEDRDTDDLAAEIVTFYDAGLASHRATLAAKDGAS